MAIYVMFFLLQIPANPLVQLWWLWMSCLCCLHWMQWWAGWEGNGMDCQVSGMEY